jgi:hypothetical protein
MGGVGSGRPGTRLHMGRARTLVLDLNGLIRCAKEAGRPTACAGVWTWQPGSTPAPVTWILHLDPERGRGTLRLRYDFQHASEPTGAQDYTVKLTATVPTHGGLRWWMLCPRTGQRCGKLYLPNGARVFACREAYRLFYTSESEGALDRAISRSLAARRRLGCTDTDTLELPFCPKPKWMRWRTYERQMAVIRESQAELLGLLQARWGHLFGR